jgi:transketolase
VNVPLDLPYTLPVDYALRTGLGAALRRGDDVALVGYGPVLLANAYRAAEELAAQGVEATVIDLPWLNRIDDEWVGAELAAFPLIVTLDNHYLEFGQGVMIGAALARVGTRARLVHIGIDEIPACGNNADVLRHHGLDAASIARAVLMHAPRLAPARGQADRLPAS